MKYIGIVLSLSLLMVFGTSTDALAQKSKVEKFTVYGNCGMCKSKIEKSLVGVKGVKFAVWSAEKQEITVGYNTKKVDIMTIHKKIAGVGYDTEKVRAADKVYNNLHGCCKYDRPKKQ